MEAKNNENIEADVVVEEGKIKNIIKKNGKKLAIGFGAAVTIIVGVVVAMAIGGKEKSPDTSEGGTDDIPAVDLNDIIFKEVDVDGDTVKVGTF